MGYKSKEMEFIKNLEIYDNGGKTLDRYTIIDLRTGKHDIFNANKLTYEAISASATGAGVYMHTHVIRGKHLGKKIPFLFLDGQLQSMIINEFKNEMSHA